MSRNRTWTTSSSIFFLISVGMRGNELRSFVRNHSVFQLDRRGETRQKRAPLQEILSVAEGNLDVAGGLNHLAIGRDKPQTIERVGDGDVADLIVLIADHRSEVSFVDELHCFHAESGAENSIERRRRATALQMTKHTGAGFFPGARRNLMRHDVADSAQPKLAFFRFALYLLSILCARAFCDNDQRTQIPDGITRANGVGHS